MPLDLAVEVLETARDQSEQMVNMYRDQVIPRAATELESAKEQLRVHSARIAEIETLLSEMKK